MRNYQSPVAVPNDATHILKSQLKLFVTSLPEPAPTPSPSSKFSSKPKQDDVASVASSAPTTPVAAAVKTDEPQAVGVRADFHDLISLTDHAFELLLQLS
jgi:hypothetical protein